MKKILGITTFVLGAVIMLTGNNVNADMFNYAVYCNTIGEIYETYPGDIIQCNISGLGNREEKINELKISYEANSAFEYLTFDYNKSFDTITENNSNVILKTSHGIPLVSSYGNIYFRINKNYSGKSVLKITVTTDYLEEETLFEINVLESNKTNHSVVYLSDIKIEGYQLNFSKNTFDYQLKIGDETSLKINPILEEDKDGWERKYTIIGNENLKNGSVIYIIASNEVAEQSIYSITVEQSQSTTTNEEKNNEINQDSTKKLIGDDTLVIILIAANVVLMIVVVVLEVSVIHKSRIQN